MQSLVVGAGKRRDTEKAGILARKGLLVWAEARYVDVGNRGIQHQPSR